MKIVLKYVANVLNDLLSETRSAYSFISRTIADRKWRLDKAAEEELDEDYAKWVKSLREKK